MLLNLTNHSFKSWEKKQQDIALSTFGDVSDYSFPIIDPEMDIDSVSEVAKKCFNDIITNYPNNLNVHLMGEYTFCYQILLLFEKAGIPCFVSTTKREVQLLDNQIKQSVFRFVRFRKYSR